MKVSVIIKALNEERNIVRAIESALAAVAVVGSGEVILADSMSTDRTVDLASAYPVRIVQLANPNDRCCGVGAEIGYRIASGDYLYILDADMELDGDFLKAAILALDSDPTLGGVGGLVEEMNIQNAEFRGRAAQASPHMRIGEVDRLNMGGLYRKSAIDKLGYLTNRNLHAFEEFELAVRLRADGYHLIRLDMPAVRHYGHTDDSFLLLGKRWRSKYAWGIGELVRESIGKKYLSRVLFEVKLYRQAALVLGWWCVLVVLSFMVLMGDMNWAAPIFILLVPIVAMSLKRRSVSDGVYVVAFLCVFTAGLIAGAFSGRKGSPCGDLNVKVMK